MKIRALTALLVVAVTLTIGADTAAAAPVCKTGTGSTGATLTLCVTEAPTTLDNAGGTSVGTPGAYTATLTSANRTSNSVLGCPGQRLTPSACVTFYTFPTSRTLNTATDYVGTDLWGKPFPVVDGTPSTFSFSLYPGFYAAGTKTVVARSYVDGAAVTVQVPLTITGAATVGLPPSPNTVSQLPQNAPRDPNAIVVGTVGDAAAGHDSAPALANRIASWGLDRFLYLGDVYQWGSYQEFLNYYHPQTHYARFNPITDGTVGNHEYKYYTNGRAWFWYFNYVNGAPTDPNRGAQYYSFEIPAGCDSSTSANCWHVIALDSEIPVTSTSPQVTWLRNDLAAHPDSRYPCTIAMWHRPRYSSSRIGGISTMQPFWDVMQNAGVDLYLTAHAHTYERSFPFNQDGTVNTFRRGPVQLIVGTGGNALDLFRDDVVPAWTAVRLHSSTAAAKLVLRSGQADLQYINQNGSLLDSATIACRTGDVASPSAPTGLTGTSSGGKVTLTWTASQGAPTGYQIYRNGKSLLDPTGPTKGYAGTATTYTDDARHVGSTYAYKVRARDAAGNESPFSAQISVTVK